MGELMRQASRLQRRIEQRREELKDEVFDAGAGNDRVTVKANGAAEITNVDIDAKLIEEEGLEMTQDLIVAAVNAALEKARTHVDAEIEKVSGGLKIPGIG